MLNEVIRTYQISVLTELVATLATSLGHHFLFFFFNKKFFPVGIGELQVCTCSVDCVTEFIYKGERASNEKRV